MDTIEKVKQILEQEVGTFDSESHTYLNDETRINLAKEICQLKDTECQARIKRELEEKLKSGSYQSGTYHFYSILVETWQEFWKREGIK